VALHLDAGSHMSLPETDTMPVPSTAPVMESTASATGPVTPAEEPPPWQKSRSTFRSKLSPQGSFAGSPVQSATPEEQPTD